MNKEELINEVSSRTGEEAGVVRSVLGETNNVVQSTLKRGEEVFFFGLGKLFVIRRAKRTGRNPHTGEPVPVPARFTAKFRPSASLAKAVKTLTPKTARAPR